MKTMIEQTRFRFSGINVGSVAAGTRIEILVSPLAAGKKIIVVANKADTEERDG